MGMPDSYCFALYGAFCMCNIEVLFIIIHDLWGRRIHMAFALYGAFCMCNIEVLLLIIWKTCLLAAGV